MQRNNDESKKLTGRVATQPTLYPAGKDAKKSNAILDIPKTPFDASRYQESLNLGMCRTRESEDSIELQRLHANKPGSGFGAAKFREMVQRSIQLGCPGKIWTDVSTSYGSPHLFYLYMGMVPDSKKESYLRVKYGMRAINALEILSECKEWNSSTLEKLDAVTLKTVRQILSREHQIDFDSVSLDDIIKNKDFILSLKDKQLEYVGEVFIPKLLEILAKDPKNKYPDTKLLGSMTMRLTDQGFERWKYCIENNFEFVPFRNFEHLKLTEDQQNKLRDIVDKRRTLSASSQM